MVVESWQGEFVPDSEYLGIESDKEVLFFS